MNDNKINTEWNLSRYFYEGLDDPRIEEDVEAYVKETEDFIKFYGEEGKISGFVSTGQLPLFMSFLEEVESSAKNLGRVFHFLECPSQSVLYHPPPLQVPSLPQTSQTFNDFSSHLWQMS